MKPEQAAPEIVEQDVWSSIVDLQSLAQTAMASSASRVSTADPWATIR